MSEGASTIKRVLLELGGNAPFIVFDSAELEPSVKGCLVAKFTELRIGDPRKEDTNIGPLVNRKAIEKVKCHVEDALVKGAFLVVSGSFFSGDENSSGNISSEPFYLMSTA